MILPLLRVCETRVAVGKNRPTRRLGEIAGTRDRFTRSPVPQKSEVHVVFRVTPPDDAYLGSRQPCAGSETYGRTHPDYPEQTDPTFEVRYGECIAVCEE